MRELCGTWEDTGSAHPLLRILITPVFNPKVQSLGMCGPYPSCSSPVPSRPGLCPGLTSASVCLLLARLNPAFLELPVALLMCIDFIFFAGVLAQLQWENDA